MGTEVQFDLGLASSTPKSNRALQACFDEHWGAGC